MKEEEYDAIKANLHEKVENSKTTYGIPLYIKSGRREKRNTFLAYVCLMKSNYSFPADSIQDSKYGWVVINGTDAGRLAKPPLKDYWKYMVVITKTGSSQETILKEPQGVLIEHPYFSGIEPPAEGESKVDLPDAPFIKKATRADIVNYYVDRHDKWRVLAPLNMRGRLLRSFPRDGWEKEAYLEGKQQSDGIFFQQNAADSWKELKENLKNAGNIQGHYEDVRKGFIRDNLIVQEDDIVTQKDRNGKEVQKTNKVFHKASVKVVEYPRLEPDRFKMAGKRFNKLLSTSPSTILKPINQWVRAVSDVEVFALAGLAAVIQVISFGKAFK